MATPELLDTLLRLSGPSGNEARPAQAWRQWCEAHAGAVGVDLNGSSWARLHGAAGAPTLAVVGHIDEIGIRVTHIESGGLLCLGDIGGWDPCNLVGQRVVLDTADGPLRGVIGRKAIHLIDPDDRGKAPKLTELRIDVGADDEQEASSLVRVGDTGVIESEPVLLRGDRLVSRALDNRVGCYVAARTLELLASEGGSPGDLLALAVVQEEIGLNGARTSAHRHRPDLAIVVDVTHESGAPGNELGSDTKHEFGSGPVIERSPTLNPKLFELIYETAVSSSIPFTLASSGRGTGTDADVFHLSRDGIPTALLSVPLRYMHSPVEMVDLRDVEHTAQLIAAFARRLTADSSFER